MTISEAYQQLKNKLIKIYEDRESENISNLVLEKITEMNRVDRIIYKDKILTANQLKTLEDFLVKLQNHTPIQYVLNEAWFAGMQFYVDESVLIPRPETEELVEWIIENLKSEIRNPKLTILDIGTGSGCIAIALKKFLPSAKISALDISNNALNIAKKNAHLNNTEIEFLRIDILKENYDLPAFDIIVSNPPYVPANEQNEMNKNVLLYEPHLALFVADKNPLLFYDVISDFSITHLTGNGSLYFEIHEDFGEAVLNLLSKKKFTSIQIKKDLQGKNRMITGSYKPV